MNIRPKKESKPKFNKEKCNKCKYHGEGCGGYGVSDSKRDYKPVYCNYSGATGTTCLRHKSSNIIEDIRGKDYENCRLYKRGKPKRYSNISIN